MTSPSTAHPSSSEPHALQNVPLSLLDAAAGGPPSATLAQTCTLTGQQQLVQPSHATHEHEPPPLELLECSSEYDSLQPFAEEDAQG